MCEQCCDEIKVAEVLHDLLNANLIEEVTYRKWTSTDRSMLETVVKTSDKFVDEFVESLKKFQKQVFFTKMQSNALKEALGENEIVVVCDFAGNCSFIVQDEVQLFL